MRIGILSSGIGRIPYLSSFTGADVRRLGWFGADVDAVAGWGRRPSTRKAVAYAATHRLPYVALEDGFLRSFGTGAHFPPIALVMDDEGIYYDCTKVSALERLLNEADDLLSPDALALTPLLGIGLSKYNHAPALPAYALRARGSARSW